MLTAIECYRVVPRNTVMGGGVTAQSRHKPRSPDRLATFAAAELELGYGQPCVSRPGWRPGGAPKIHGPMGLKAAGQERRQQRPGQHRDHEERDREVDQPMGVGASLPIGHKLPQQNGRGEDDGQGHGEQNPK